MLKKLYFDDKDDFHGARYNYMKGSPGTTIDNILSDLSQEVLHWRIKQSNCYETLKLWWEFCILFRKMRVTFIKVKILQHLCSRIYLVVKLIFNPLIPTF